MASQRRSLYPLGSQETCPLLMVPQCLLPPSESLYRGEICSTEGGKRTKGKVSAPHEYHFNTHSCSNNDILRNLFTYLLLVAISGPGIFGVPLSDSIRYANVAISLTNEQGESFIYGYVPIVVAKCGVFLKEKGQPLLSRFSH